MIATIWIEPHERHEAIQAYKDRLSPAEIEQIKNAPETALVRLDMNICDDRSISAIHIVEEG